MRVALVGGGVIGGGWAGRLVENGVDVLWGGVDLDLDVMNGGSNGDVFLVFPLEELFLSDYNPFGGDVWTVW